MRRIDGFRRAGFHIIRQLECAGGHLEKVDGAEIVEEFGDPRAGIEQFDAATVGRAVRIALQAKSRKDAEKGAVHQHTLGQIKGEAFKSFLRQFIQERFEIRAGREIRASGDFYANKLFTDEH